LTSAAFAGWHAARGAAPAPAEIIAAINQARQPAVRAIKLQAGDVLVLDNFR
jgi:hypothetical protein